MTQFPTRDSCPTELTSPIGTEHGVEQQSAMSNLE